tara:strand:+ start:969 stop:2024 length:1056 start_codon:yes stop_codon:yes gene_type:complete
MKYFIDKILNLKNEDIFKIKVINKNNYSVEFLNYGGYFHSINIPYKNDKFKTEDVLLGYNDLRNYLYDEYYLNSIVGRVCGRISESKFILNNKKYKLFANDMPHHIHGGKEGFNKKIWKIDNLKSDNDYFVCRLSYKSKHLEENYPGELECLATYYFDNLNKLQIVFEAKTDLDTIVNITNHNYWNFHGHKNFYQNISEHFLKINSDKICETDTNQIPSGKMLNVKDTKYDFNEVTKINENILKNQGIDHCYQISQTKDSDVKRVASIYSNLTKMGMELYSNQPGLQLYTGNMMDKKYPGKHDKSYGYQYGICLEAQKFPDAINQNNFVNPILRTGDIYKSKIIMHFKNDF